MYGVPHDASVRSLVKAIPDHRAPQYPAASPTATSGAFERASRYRNRFARRIAGPPSTSRPGTSSRRKLNVSPISRAARWFTSSSKPSTGQAYVTHGRARLRSSLSQATTEPLDVEIGVELELEV